MEDRTPLMRQIKMSRLRLLGAALAAIAAFPAAAEAACPDKVSRQVFSRFGDYNWYFAAPGGTFEPATSAWTQSGSSVVFGNETYFVNSSADRQSLRVPAGASATSPSFCVSLQHPTLRLFARKTSGSGGTLTVEILTASGTKVAGTVVNIGQYVTWRPTQAMDLASKLSLSGTDSTATVRLRVRADSAGAWAVDDVFIDPYRR
jgi:hypothetical protein